MTMSRLGAVALLGLLTLQPAFGKAPSSPKKTGEAQELSGITWHRNLAAALRLAQRSKPAKPVLLLRVLGELDGGC